MANSASDARSSEQELRSLLIEAHGVDAMVAVGPNMFYTVTLPCTLWFFDKNKCKTPRADTFFSLTLDTAAGRLIAHTASGHRRKSGSSPTWSTSIAVKPSTIPLVVTKPTKPKIAFAQTYFAIQTRRAELIEQRLLEAERVSARHKLSATEKNLSAVAQIRCPFLIEYKADRDDTQVC